MRLHIDTSSNQKTIVRLGEKELVQDSSVWHSQVVLPMIQKLLTTTSHKLEDITEIEVVDGSGLSADRRRSFTGLRVGVAIANALGFALSIPVNGKKVDSLEIVEPVYD